jgi:hypothetical protein
MEFLLSHILLVRQFQKEQNVAIRKELISRDSNQHRRVTDVLKSTLDNLSINSTLNKTHTTYFSVESIL